MIFSKAKEPKVECNCWAIHALETSEKQIPFVMQVVFNSEWGNIECRHNILPLRVFGLDAFLWGDRIETPTVEIEKEQT